MPGRHNIWRPQQITKPSQEGLALPGGALCQYDRLRAILFYYLLQFVDNGLKSLIPRNSLPLPLSFFTDSLEWILDSIRMIYELVEGEALAANATVVGRKVGVTFDLDNSAISDVNEDTASTMATSTVGLDYLFFNWYTHITSLRFGSISKS
jgi:hypothetical protein